MFFSSDDLEFHTWKTGTFSNFLSPEKKLQLLKMHIIFNVSKGAIDYRVQYTLHVEIFLVFASPSAYATSFSLLTSQDSDNHKRVFDVDGLV